MHSFLVDAWVITPLVQISCSFREIAGTGLYTRYAGGPLLHYSRARDAAHGKADRAEVCDATPPLYCGCSLVQFQSQPRTSGAPMGSTDIRLSEYQARICGVVAGHFKPRGVDMVFGCRLRPWMSLRQTLPPILHQSPQIRVSNRRRRWR